MDTSRLMSLVVLLFQLLAAGPTTGQTVQGTRLDPVPGVRVKWKDLVARSQKSLAPSERV